MPFLHSGFAKFGLLNWLYLHCLSLRFQHVWHERIAELIYNPNVKPMEESQTMVTTEAM